MKTDKVTRFEIINHTACDECGGTGKTLTETDSAAGQSIAFEKECPNCRGMGSPGRTVYVNNSNLQFDLELQDDDRTLKLFIHERIDEDGGN